jgi:hypothetical protein
MFTLAMVTVASSGNNINSVKAQTETTSNFKVCVVITGPAKVNLLNPTHLTGYAKSGFFNCITQAPGGNLQWRVDGTFIGTGNSVNHQFDCTNPNHISFQVKLTAKVPTVINPVSTTKVLDCDLPR